jgi:tripartite-type tricarboxylate transporter receptor subunit TctC
MRHLLLALILSVVASPVFAANYATCILDKMPGVANDVAARAVYQVCKKEHPGGLQAVEQGSGRGFFGYSSGAECTAKKASDTHSQQAAYMIGTACRRLYEEPNYFDRYDPPR